MRWVCQYTWEGKTKEDLMVYDEVGQQKQNPFFWVVHWPPQSAVQDFVDDT